METAELVKLLAGLEHDHDNGESPGSRLCHAAAQQVGVSGAAIMLMGDIGHGSSLGHSDDVVRAVEDLQFTLGEGPGIDAHTIGRPVLEPNLSHPSSSRWPTFAPAAVSEGVCGAFGFPLRMGAVRLGALDLYSVRPAMLGADQVADALVLANVVTQTLVGMQADAAPDSLPDEIDPTENLRAQVHQASGMLSKQLEITITDALVRLRAYAYAQGRPINDVAGDVVTRDLHIE